MQRQSRLSASAITLVLFAALAVMPASRAVADDQNESVVGTWIGEATFDTPPGTPPLVEAELASVHRGGIVIGTSGIDHSSQNPFVPPGLVVELSDYLGTWEPIGDSDKIDVTFKRLLFAGPDTPKSIYGQVFQGQNVGMASIQSVVTLQHTMSGDILSGPFTFQLTTLDGTPVPATMGGKGSGTVSFSRVAIEPLASSTGLGANPWPHYVGLFAVEPAKRRSAPG